MNIYENWLTEEIVSLEDRILIFQLADELHIDIFPFTREVTMNRTYSGNSPLMYGEVKRTYTYGKKVLQGGSTDLPGFQRVDTSLVIQTMQKELLAKYQKEGFHKPEVE